MVPLSRIHCSTITTKKFTLGQKGGGTGPPLDPPLLRDSYLPVCIETAVDEARVTLGQMLELGHANGPPQDKRHEAHNLQTKGKTLQLKMYCACFRESKLNSARPQIARY